jgi:cbb3-type cytochrome oxidase subunit 3
MFKDVLNHMDLSALTTAGLLLFFIVFIAVSLYAFTRPTSQAQRWARIPLTRENDDRPVRRNEEEEA